MVKRQARVRNHRQAEVVKSKAEPTETRKTETREQGQTLIRLVRQRIRSELVYAQGLYADKDRCGQLAEKSAKEGISRGDEARTKLISTG